MAAGLELAATVVRHHWRLTDTRILCACLADPAKPQPVRDFPRSDTPCLNGRSRSSRNSMADGGLRVFISAVTSEFDKARNELAADLRARGAAVSIETDFVQGGDARTVLELLHDYIRDCTAVICLVGKRSGHFPPPDAAPRFAKMLPPGITQASYTQWEFFFARHYGRRLYVYRANEDCVPDEPVSSGADQPALQDAFIQHVNAENIPWTPFSNIDQLARAVLKEPWPRPGPSRPQETSKPIVLPYPSIGPLFKGREGFMQQLHESLHASGNTAITSKALYGLGGIGKTRAAVEYAWAHESEYTALLFVVAETPEALHANTAALSRTLVPQLDATDDTVRFRAVLEWLAGNPGWFLILDNVDSPEALAAVEGLFGQLRGGHIVVTSRLSDFSANLVPLALDVLPTRDAVALLLARTEGRRRRSAHEEAIACEVAIELGGLALALEQAGAYIAKRRLTFGSYLQEWRSARRHDVLNWFDATVTGYPKAVAVTWQTSVDQLTNEGRRLLERLAWLAPEKVPESLLDVSVADFDSDSLQKALDDLATYSLITRDAEGPFFLVHRLVQDVTRRSLGSSRRHTTLAEAFSWINAAFPDDPQDFRSWPKAEPLAPHARSLIAGLEAEDADFGTLSTLLMAKLGVLLQAKGLYVEAESLLQRDLAISEKSLGPEHPDVATSLHNLAMAFRTQGRYSEAEALYQRSLAVREKALGPDHPDVGTTLNNLAVLYRQQGRDAEAEPLLRRSLAIREKALGPDHQDVGGALNNLAVVYRAQRRYREAELLYQRALAIAETALGPDHPQVAVALNNLAGLYFAQRRDAEAEPLFRRDLAITEKALGPDHPDLGISLNNLAELYRRQNRTAEAAPLYRRSVNIFAAVSRQMGRTHPSLDSVVQNYREFLVAMGKNKTEIHDEIARLKKGED